MAPTFSAGSDAAVRDIDGREVFVHVVADYGDFIEGVVFGFPPVPYRCGDQVVFPAAGTQAIEAEPVYRHCDGLVAFTGSLR